MDPPGKGTHRARIAVVDDHPVVRDSLAWLLDAHEDLRVVAQGRCGKDALALVRQGGFEVLVMDLEMPGQSGMDVITSIHHHAPGLGVLIFSAHAEERLATTMLRRGAKGYLDKRCDPREIVEAVRCIAAGRAYVPSRIADLLVDEMESADAVPLHSRLTTRELQVLLRMAHGQRTAQMAHELFLSPKTVSACRMRVLRKLGMRSAADVTQYAVKSGLMD